MAEVGGSGADGRRLSWIGDELSMGTRNIPSPPLSTRGCVWAVGASTLATSPWRTSSREKKRIINENKKVA